MVMWSIVQLFQWCASFSITFCSMAPCGERCGILPRNSIKNLCFYGHNWLRNPYLRGDLAHQSVSEQETKIIRNTHTPIINREEAAQVDRLLRRNKSLPPRTASAPRSLAGLVTCVVVGAK
jgi:hypothetical protein